MGASKPAAASSPLSSKIAFDRDNNLYMLATSGGVATLFQSADGGRTFAACAIPGRETNPSRSTSSSSPATTSRTGRRRSCVTR